MYYILKLYKVRVNGYLEKILQKYADDNNAENFLSFELESIAKNAIWLAKKKYIFLTCYDQKPTCWTKNLFVSLFDVVRVFKKAPQGAPPGQGGFVFPKYNF